MNVFGARALRALGGVALAGLLVGGPVLAGPSIVVDASTGQVLEQDHATQRWFPASLTKLLTVYVALKQVRDGRINIDTPLVYSSRAAHMPPSKMGFRVGTQVTLDNALKMLMVKSANDIAITVAEGLSGSVEDFANEMNQTAAQLGLQESHFTTPNGLHNVGNYSSARDLALIAISLYRDFPDHADLFDIGALDLDGQIIATHNWLLGRYPGTDGMKTGYVCASGFNVVASATRAGRKLITVVLGAPRTRVRDLKAAALFDAGFSGELSNQGRIDRLAATSGGPIDIRDQICGRNRRQVAEEDSAVPIATTTGGGDPMRNSFLQGAGLTLEQRAGSQIAFMGRPAFTPIAVFTGPRPGWTGDVRMARSTPDAAASPSVAAYAPAEASGGPLQIDPKAQPMKGPAVGRAARPGRRVAALPPPSKAEPAKAAAAKGPASKNAATDAKPAKTAGKGHAVTAAASVPTPPAKTLKVKPTVKPAPKVAPAAAAPAEDAPDADE